MSSDNRDIAGESDAVSRLFRKEKAMSFENPLDPADTIESKGKEYLDEIIGKLNAAEKAKANLTEQLVQQHLLSLCIKSMLVGFCLAALTFYLFGEDEK